ncbi:MAG: tetratricopeptide repeat protein [Planctomycetaceae bacterium]
MSNVDPQLAAAVAGGGKSGPSKNTTPAHDDIPERLARVRTAFPTLPVDELPPATSLIVKIWRQLCARAQRPSSSPHMPFGTGADSSVDAGFAAELKRGRTDEPPKYALPKPNAAPDEAEDLTADARAVPINHRLLIVSAIAIVLGLSAVHGVHALQVSRLARQSRELGIQARESGDAGRAIAHLRRYLAIAPKDIDAVEGLAFSIAETADTPRDIYRAVLLFERILRDSPGSPDVRRQLVGLLTELGKFTSANNHLNELINKDPQNATLLALLANNLERQNRFAEAAKAYAQASAAEPAELTHYQNLARVLHAQLDQPAGAAEVLNNLVLNNPASPTGYLARARFQFDQGNLRKARIDGVRAWRLSPDDVDVCVLMVDLAVEAPWPFCPVSLDDVRRTLEADAADDDSDQRAAVALVQLQLKAGDYEQAQKQIQSILKADPDSEMARSLSTDIRTMHGDVDAAREANEQLVNDLGRRGYLTQILKARAELRAENWNEAVALFRTAFDDDRAPLVHRTRAGLYVADCWEKLGHRIRRHDTYVELLRLNPDSSEIISRLADSYRDSGNYEEAIRQYRRLGDSPESLTEIARLMIRENRRLPHAKQRWDEVEAAINQVEQAASSDPGIGIALQAELRHAQGDSGNAANLLHGGLKSHPADRRLWLLLLQIYESRQDWDAADSALDQLDQLSESKNSTIDLRISFAASAGRKDKLDALRSRVDGLDEEHRLPLLRVLARAWRQVGEHDKSLECWSIVETRFPDDLSIKRARFTLAMLRGDDEQARELISRMRAIEGEFGEYWQLAEANRLYALADQGNQQYLTEVRQILETLDRRLPETASLKTLLGDICRMEGDIEHAVDYYKTVVNRFAPSRHCVLQLAELLYEQGEYAEVGQLIRRFEQSSTVGIGPQLARLGTSASFQDDEAAEALRFAEIGTASAGNSPEAEIWLGQVHRLAGRPQEAELHFRRAIEIAPTEGHSWIALVAFLSSAGRTEEMISTIEAAQKSVDESELDFTLAQCFEAAGDLESAAAHYENLVSEGLSSVDRLESTIQFYVRSQRNEHAARVLRGILLGSAEPHARIAAAARRLLADLLTTSGRYPDHIAALELIDENLKNSTSNAGQPDLRLKARLLAQSSVRADHREAVRLYDVLRGWGPLSVSESKTLAQLHVTLANTEAAKREARSLVARAPHDVNVLGFAAKLMLDAEADDEILIDWLGRLKALRPDDMGTLVLSSRWLVNQARYDEALAVLSSPADSGREVQFAVALDEIARTLDQRGHVAIAEEFARSAEQFYRQAAADDPLHQLNLARFLLRWFRGDEALQTCHQLRGKVSDEILARMYVQLIKRGRIDPADADETRQWLKSCCDAAPDSWPLHLAYAHLLAWNQQYSDAITAYLHVLELIPDNVEALNEAALLLALTKRDTKQAAEYIDRAIHHAGPLGALVDSRGSVEFALGAPDDAIRSAESAISEAPSSVRYLHLAQAQFAAGRKDLSKEALRTAFKMGLHVNVVHPLEVAAFQQLRTDLNL